MRESRLPNTFSLVAYFTRMQDKKLESHETHLQSLLFSPEGTVILDDFIQQTDVATRKWLLQGADEREEEDEWGWKFERGAEDGWGGGGITDCISFSFILSFSIPLLIFHLCFSFLSSTLHSDYGLQHYGVRRQWTRPERLKKSTSLESKTRNCGD